jgi:type VI protein secretion system component VasK
MMPVDFSRGGEMKHTKRIIGLTAGVVSAWLVLKLGILSAVLLFLVAGVIPGTSLSVPPIVMLSLLGAFAIVMLFWIKRQGLIKQIRAQKAEAAEKHKTSLHQHPAPLRRRFTHLQA